MSNTQNEIEQPLVRPLTKLPEDWLNEFVQAVAEAIAFLNNPKTKGRK